jgi:SNF2 family DNA or RNA helicase
MKYEPYPYQANGIKWLLQKPYAGLIMRPGLGKTSVVLATRVLLKRKGLGKRCLVIAPFMVASLVWKEQIEEWQFPLTTGFAHGAKFEEVLQDPDLELVTMTCDGIARLVQSFTPLDIQKLFDHLIVDESTKFKHVSSKRFKLLREYLPAFARRTILTGTPAPNGYLDLFGQTFLVDRGERLGKYITHYIMSYFDAVGYGGYTKVLKEGADKLIQEKLKDIFYFVNDEALGLPKFRENVILVELPPKARKAYDELEREMVLEVKKNNVTAVNAAVLSGKLRQLANGAVYVQGGQTMVMHDAKVEALLDLVEQMGGASLMVAYEFTQDRDRIVAALQHHFGKAAPLLVISGDTSKKQRTEILWKRLFTLNIQWLKLLK